MTQLSQTELLNLIERYNNTDPKTIQKNVSKALKEAGLTAKEAAEAIGVKETTVDSWHNIKSKHMKITFENAVKVAEVTGNTIEDLLKG